MKLSENKVLITGATEGIGSALTTKFVSLGNIVLAIGRNGEKLKQMADQEQKIVPFQCDISKMDELERLSMFIKQQHPDLNILINNAGIQYNYHFAEEAGVLNKMEHELNVNLLAPLRLIALTLPVLQQNDNAAIVNVSSALGLVPKMQAPVYCGTKAGLHVFTKALRYQLKSVKVFEIIPPLVATNMTRGRGRNKITPEQLADQFIRSFAKDKFEISIGKTKLLKLINRIAPALADRIMKGGM